ncbi:hypothetical protein F4703DRAFT_1938452 [Phycomyces blakesleeanus]
MIYLLLLSVHIFKIQYKIISAMSFFCHLTVDLYIFFYLLFTFRFTLYIYIFVKGQWRSLEGKLE